MTKIIPPSGISGAANRREAALAEAHDAQLAVSDPAVSAWVSANAGTGKTYVLVQRILRLLLSGAEPQSLLCLTYTRNAAAEMEARVLAELGAWSTAPDADLGTKLDKLLGRPASREETLRARCLFGHVIDAARGLPILTIHSFCEQVLRRFPVEAGMPPNFDILTDEDAEAILRASLDTVLDRAAREPDTPLGMALAAIIRHADETRFSDLVKTILQDRGTLRGLLAPAGGEDWALFLEARLRRHFGLGAEDSEETILARLVNIADDLAPLVPLCETLRQGKPTDQDTAKRMAAVRAATSPEARIAALRTLFLTNGGTPRTRLFTTETAQRLGSAAGALPARRARFAALDLDLCAAGIVSASSALLHLTAAVSAAYEQEKRPRALVDFDDLIERTLLLLGDAPSAAWVLFQLDSRISHILVDEAQDTSAAQWAIIERLTQDFFAGAGARQGVPTVFAVGDAKQSIYSFQGAEPRLMREREAVYAGLAGDAGFPWRALSLGLSFRSVPAVLRCVDAVWQAVLARGDAADGETIAHRPFRADEPGLVELWEPERPAKRDAGETWSPQADEDAEADAAARLGARIADQIATWLETGEMLASEARPIAPRDILILLNRREPMLDVLLAALKARRVPVAGADRLSLLDSIAVADLIALGDALVMPDDDLALAAALKSPLFNLDDDDLFALAHGRSGSLWSAVMADDRYANAAGRLRSWQARAFGETPFGFYHHVLDSDDFRRAFTRRLGPQCLDALDEFLACAETFSQRDRTLSAFLSWVRASGLEIKRDSGQRTDAVRVMTVHAAKGLEAEIVFLADTCRRAEGRAPGILRVDDGLNAPDLPVWLVKGGANHPAVAEAKSQRARHEREESMRLLYVAMTRARDRLYVTGFQDRDKLADGCWYDVVADALIKDAVVTSDHAGRRIWRIGDPPGATAGAASTESSSQAARPRSELPAWVHRLAHPEASPRALAPSGQEGGLHSPPFAPRDDAEPESAEDSRLAGLLMHRLLQSLPSCAEQGRAGMAARIAESYRDALPATLRDELIREALSLIAHPELRDLFAAPSLSETGLAGEIAMDDGLALAFGQADRIVLLGGEALILDYKTGRTVPRCAEDAPRAHLAQIALYRDMLARALPGMPVRAALLYTKGPSLLDVSGPLLDTVMADLRHTQAARP